MVTIRSEDPCAERGCVALRDVHLGSGP